MFQIDIDSCSICFELFNLKKEIPRPLKCSVSENIEKIEIFAKKNYFSIFTTPNALHHGRVCLSCLNGFGHSGQGNFIIKNYKGY